MPVGIRRLIGMKIRVALPLVRSAGPSRQRADQIRVALHAALVRSASEPMRKGQENLAEVDKSHRPERWSRSGSY
jgi:hypothetical protein